VRNVRSKSRLKGKHARSKKRPDLRNFLILFPPCCRHYYEELFGGNRANGSHGFARITFAAGFGKVEGIRADYELSNAIDEVAGGYSSRFRFGYSASAVHHIFRQRRYIRFSEAALKKELASTESRRSRRRVSSLFVSAIHRNESYASHRGSSSTSSHVIKDYSTIIKIEQWNVKTDL